MTATIDGEYRYDLVRSWGAGPRVTKRATFIMLNPSTADAEQDDPTIRRCIGFAKREGCDGLTVANLYALRATDPRELWQHADPVGPRNDDYLRLVVNDTVLFGGPLILAWGANAKADRIGALLRIISSRGGRPLALGVTKAGAPRHPLYLRADAPLNEWLVTS